MQRSRQKIDKGSKFGTQVVLVIPYDFRMGTTKNSKGVVQKALIINLQINCDHLWENRPSPRIK